jgi:hypothetical protein
MGMGIFPYEIVLKDFPFEKSCGPETTILNFCRAI